MIYSVIVIIYRVLLVQWEQDSAGVKKKRSKPSLNSAIDFFDLLRRSHSFTQVLVVWKRLKVFRESPRLISFSMSMSMLRFFQLDNSCSNYSWSTVFSNFWSDVRVATVQPRVSVLVTLKVFNKQYISKDRARGQSLVLTAKWNWNTIKISSVDVQARNISQTTSAVNSKCTE